VPIRVLTEVTLVHVGAALPNITACERAVCTLSSAAGGWTRETELGWPRPSWHWAGGTVARPYEGSRGGHTSCPVHYHHPVLLSRIAAESAVDLISRLLPVCHVMEKQ
jgi:hypothetical protein